MTLDGRGMQTHDMQAVCPQTSQGTAENWSLTRRKPITACQQDWHTSRRTDLTSRWLVKNATAQLERQPVLTSTRLKRIGRYLFHTPRAVWEFPLQTEENVVKIDGLSDADAAGYMNTRRSIIGGCLTREDFRRLTRLG